jgi:hypothetical protein
LRSWRLARGGSLVDLFDILFHNNTGWDGYNAADTTDMLLTVINPEALARDNPQVLLEAADRTDDHGRAAILGRIQGWKLLGNADLRDFAFRMAVAPAKDLRDHAARTLEDRSADQVMAEAPQRLAAKKAGERAAMVGLLGKLATDAAMDMLRTHRSGEKSAELAGKIDAILQVADAKSSEPAANPDGPGYRAIDGSWVVIPPMPELDTEGEIAISGDAKVELLAILRAENARRRAKNRNADKVHYNDEELPGSYVDDAIAFLLDPPLVTDVEDRDHIRQYFVDNLAKDWTLSQLEEMSHYRGLIAAFALCSEEHHMDRTLEHLLDKFYFEFEPSAAGSFLKAFLFGDSGDYRVLEKLAIDRKLDKRIKTTCRKRPAWSGDLLEVHLKNALLYTPEIIGNAFWPALAENLDRMSTYL